VQNKNNKKAPYKTQQLLQNKIMKKVIIFTILILTINLAANAQNASSTAQQTIQLALSNALDITFTGSGSAAGSTVSLPFTSVTDYANGVESAAQQLKVRSNKNFNVTVSAAASNFTVTSNGNTTASSMPVAGVLDVMVSANQTGGTIASAYSNYGGGVSTTPATLISGGNNGSNQTFSVKYKATPGFTYPAGTYTVDVVYTATQQ
jgi:hypothetical protein